MPFGEYIPYRGFFKHLANLSSVPLDAIPGHGNGVLHTPAGPLGTLISYEVFYAGRGWVATRAGARAPRRPHQHLVLPDEPGAHSGDRGRPPPGHLRRPRRRPGGAHRVQRRRSTIAARSWRAPIWRCAPSSSETSSCGRVGPSTSAAATSPCSCWRVLVVAGWLVALATDPIPPRARASRRRRRLTRTPARRARPPGAGPRLSLDSSSPWRAATICRMPSFQSTVVGPASSCMRVRSSCTLSMVCSVGSKRRLETGEPRQVGAPFLDAHRRAPAPVDHGGRHRCRFEERRQHAEDVVARAVGGRRSGRPRGPGSPNR